MTESLDQFIARSNQPTKRLPLWGSALLFLFVFFVLQVVYGASRGSAFEYFVVGDLTVAPAAELIKQLTPSVRVKALGNQLTAPGGGITVLKGCEGTEIVFMLIAAFAVVAMSRRRKLIGLGLGVLLVFCLNQVRLVTLFYAFRSDPALFNILHETVAPIVLIVAVALYVFFWMAKQETIEEANASTTS